MLAQTATVKKKPKTIISFSSSTTIIHDVNWLMSLTIKHRGIRIDLNS